ncbi:hypothetical protein AOB60_17930 [Streptomyces noursei]|uniref:Uncharacterized protein n=1 Tax=Streptomyces noursei TaxID=1971 RepID=A0A2N8PMX0_STRNR|nr:hypothetical protein AOB60_17930 [Streptomyces noursei]
MQKPSAVPGRPSRPRPTGAPHSPRLQNRFRSGTSGCASTAARGSRRGTCSTATSPAPNRPRDAPEPPPDPEAGRPLPRPLPRTTTGVRSADPLPARPPGRCAGTCVPTVRRPRAPLGGGAATVALPASTRCVNTVAVADSSPSADTTGASPHTSQYSSPSPTSS